jgi:hypothetical protein
MKNYQIVWSWKPGLRLRRYTEGSWSYIYEWILVLGFLQIRKWSKRKLKR